jgi:uncharacterized zinc-type alcohol dehydrogenase-like protein
VQYCGICHSDLEMIDNNWQMSAYPLVPGHEVVGTVTEAGTAVNDIAVGDVVGLGWTSSSCLKCRYCKRGKEHLCPQQGGTIVQRHGGFADRVRCQSRWAIRIPPGVNPANAGPLFCGGTTVWSPLRHYGVLPGMRTAVVGIGGLGHMAVQFLAKMGTEVTAISSTRSKEEESRQFGASKFIATRDTNELEKAVLTFDFILSTVSASIDWEALVNALAPEGKLCIAGVPDDALKLQAFGLIMFERAVVGGRTGSPSDTMDMLDFCALHGVEPRCEQFAMNDVNAGIDHVRANKARYRAVLAA